MAIALQMVQIAVSCAENNFMPALTWSSHLTFCTQFELNFSFKTNIIFKNKDFFFLICRKYYFVDVKKWGVKMNSFFQTCLARSKLSTL